MSLQLQHLYCRLIKVYNIKCGTEANAVIYVLIWVPETTQAHCYFSTLVKHMSRGRRGEIKGSLGWECTPTFSYWKGKNKFPDGSTLSSSVWNIKKKKKEKKRIKFLILHLGFVLYGLCSHLRRLHFENLLCHCLYENDYKVTVLKRQLKLLILITCFYCKCSCSVRRRDRSFM